MSLVSATALPSSSVLTSCIPAPSSRSLLSSSLLPSIPISSTPVTATSLFLSSTPGDVVAPSAIAAASINSSVPRPSIWSRARVASVLCLSWVPVTSRVWLPGPVGRAAGPDSSPYGTLKLTEGSRPVQGAVARDSRAHPSHLLLDARVMLNAPGDVCPGTVLLALGYIIPPPGTHHRASVPYVGLRTVPREPGAGDSNRSVRIIVIIILCNFLTLPGWGACDTSCSYGGH